MELHFAKFTGSICSIIIVKLKEYMKMWQERYHCQSLLQQDLLPPVAFDVTSWKLHQCLVALFIL